MPDDFVIATNPEEGTTLPFLVRIPLGREGVVLKVKDRWPRTAKVYCHPSAWPDEPEILERVPVRSCVRRGPAIDLVLDRGRENRSQFVMTRIRGGREAIFWQSRRTAKMARPAVSLPTARAAGQRLQILVDHRERYAWRFGHQQAEVEKTPLDVGDYAVRSPDGVTVAVVERKTFDDLVATLTSGRLRYLLAELDSLPHAAVVVEDRYSAVFKLERVRPAVVAEGLAECAVRHPRVPIVFAETRALAQEWTYRFFGAALAASEEQSESTRRLVALPAGRVLDAAEPTTREVRAWARANDIDVPDRGRLRPEVWEAFRRATGRG
ncbi:ERCC4 domain-containing protein [Mobilicoccus massiliensis]|uniref:ERCC4 domain-containing protein n=1 Tax=Mobilicoccus massiliensis TaxID=1522310 RepID=UPI00058D5A57|nr:histone-like nucleoid-structuring protein Lsr2 [Mobilicoccus massiliensis]